MNKRQIEMIDEDFYENTIIHDLHLNNQKISNKEFNRCRFESCEFQKALFDSCKFENCEFNSCNLSLVNPRASIFSGIQFKFSKLLGIDWTVTTTISFAANFDECLLSNSSFFGMNLSKTKMLNCKAHKVDFAEVDLSFSELQGTDFENTRFFKTNLAKANLQGAKNYIIDTTNNNITKAIFSYPEVMSLLYNFDIVIQ